jgi:hypothetical protein
MKAPKPKMSMAALVKEMVGRYVRTGEKPETGE